MRIHHQISIESFERALQKSTQITHSKAKANGICGPFRMAFKKKRKNKKKTRPLCRGVEGEAAGAAVKRNSAQTTERTTD